MKKNKGHSQGGFALFVAVVTASIILSIGISILNITLKQFQLSGTSRESEMAFSAADAGLECAMYWNQSKEGIDSPHPDGMFAPTAPSPVNVACMGKSAPGSGGSFFINWGTPPLCAIVSVVRSVAPAGGCFVGTCTVIESRGYNKACSLAGNPPTDPRAVERALRAYYYGP